MSVESAPVSQALAVLASLSLQEKLKFLTTFTAAFAKEAKKGLKSSARKSSSSGDEAKKRKTAPATYAWLSYPKVLESQHPELFTGVTNMPDRLKIVKEYRAEHAAEYESYKQKYIEDMTSGKITPPVHVEKQKKSKAEPALIPSSAEASPVLTAAPAPTEPPAVGESKLAQMKKKLAQKKAEAATSSSSNAAPAPPPAKEEKPKVKRVSVAKKGKAVAATTTTEPGEGEEFITVDGKNYIRLLETNGCFVRNDNGSFGAWAGVYDEESKTIDASASPK